MPSATEPVRYRNIIQAITAAPWAILPETLQAITELIALRAAGGRFSAEEIEQRIEAGPGSRQPYQSGTAVAVIPVTGVLMPRASLVSQMSGATSLQSVGAAIDAAAADDGISAIVLEVDSPGGSVGLVPETAAKVRAAASQKRVVAVANTMAASAAYWIASQATEVVVAPSALVGSIGVVQAHEDHSGEMEQKGVATTFIHAGRFKVEGHPYGPLDDDARASMQAMVDDFYGLFVADVAKGRGVSAATVRSDYGEGRVLTAKKALAAGMADRIDTLESTLARVLRAPNSRPGARAELNPAIDAQAVADLFEVPVEWVDPDAEGPDAPQTERERDLLAQIHARVTDTTTRLKEA